MLNLLISFFRSMVSGEATPEVVALRAKQCFAPCSEKVKQTINGQPGDFCRSCGCGVRPEAELHRKIRYAYLECPLKKPGFSNENRV